MSGKAQTPPAATTGTGTPPEGTPPAETQTNGQSGTPGDQASEESAAHPEKTIDETPEVVVKIGAKYKMVNDEPVEVQAESVGVYTRAWWESLYRDEDGKTVQFRATLLGYPVWTNKAKGEYEIGPIVNA